MNNDGGEIEVIPRVTQTPASERLSSEVVRGLYEAHGAELLAFLIGVLRDASAAQDVSQITFRRLVESGHSVREETMKGWIFKVALREALVYRRQNSLRDRHLKEYSLHSTPRASSEASSFDDNLLKDETVTRLKQLLTQLPADQQFVVRQRIYENKTFAAIADELSLPLGTVLTRMRIALEKIRKWFG